MGFTIDTLDVALRSFFSILFLFIITRLMGRKQISQLSFFDYVIGISIGSIAAGMATGLDIPYLHGFISMAVYTIVAIIISILTNKSIFIRRFVNGRAYLLIKNGKILEKNLGKVRYDVNDLLAEARYAGYFNINDIECAIMEASGRISFLPKSQTEPIKREDLFLHPDQENLCANLIIDGKIMFSNLKQAGFNEEWLKIELKKINAPKIEDIILAMVQTSNKNSPELFIYKKTQNLVQKTFLD